MTKPSEKTREELTAEIEDSKKKIRQFENREKMLRQKLSKEERRTRSHRLIVRGAVFESEDGQREYAEWKAKQQAEQENKV